MKISTSWKIAAARAGATSVLVGALAFLTAWSQTSDLKLLLIPSLTASLTVLAARLGAEGYADRPR